jgi:hypothetical protein
VKIDADFGAVGRLAHHMGSFVGAFPGAMEAYNEAATERLLQLVIKYASGRPGPNVVTGRYISNFMIVDGRVVNHSPQTHRLEYGYSGTDSLGRTYHQPPFPHFRPALQEMRQEYRRGIVPVIKRTWNTTS